MSSPRCASRCGACRSAPSSGRQAANRRRAAAASSSRSARLRSPGGAPAARVASRRNAWPGRQCREEGCERMPRALLDFRRPGAAHMRVHEVECRQSDVCEVHLVCRDARAAFDLDLVEAAAHAVGRSEETRRPRVQHRLGRRARRPGLRCPAPVARRLRGGFGRKQERDPVCQGVAAARCAHEVELWRRGGTAGDRVERCTAARRVAAHQLVHALRRHGVGHRIDRVIQRRQRLLQRGVLRVAGYDAEAVAQQRVAVVRLAAAMQFEAIDDNAHGRVCGRRAIRVVDGRHAPRRDGAEVVDELVGAQVVQTTLEPIPEQRSKRLPGAYAVEQPLRQPHAARRQVDRERPVGRATVSSGDRCARAPPWRPGRATAHG